MCAVTNILCNLVSLQSPVLHPEGVATTLLSHESPVAHVPEHRWWDQGHSWKADPSIAILIVEMVWGLREPFA